jgi:RNA polymerase sigma-70 factor (ECF subfamily)
LPPTDPRSDAELVEALNGGDLSAFDAIYYRYRDRVSRLAQRFTGNEEDALDVLQETFAYVHRKFPGFLLTSAMMTFLYPVVKHLSLAARRKRQRMSGDDAALETAVAAECAAAPGAARAELSAVLACLPLTHREVLLLRFVDGLSLEEIAAVMKIPLGTVKSRIHNALATLRADTRTRAYFEPEVR